MLFDARQVCVAPRLSFFRALPAILPRDLLPPRFPFRQKQDRSAGKSKFLTYRPRRQRNQRCSRLEVWHGNSRSTTNVPGCGAATKCRAICSAGGYRQDFPKGNCWVPWSCAPTPITVKSKDYDKQRVSMASDNCNARRARRDGEYGGCGRP